MEKDVFNEPTFEELHDGVRAEIPEVEPHIIAKAVGESLGLPTKSFTDRNGNPVTLVKTNSAERKQTYYVGAAPSANRKDILRKFVQRKS